MHEGEGVILTLHHDPVAHRVILLQEGVDIELQSRIIQSPVTHLLHSLFPTLTTVSLSSTHIFYFVTFWYLSDIFAQSESRFIFFSIHTYHTCMHIHTYVYCAYIRLSTCTYLLWLPSIGVQVKDHRRVQKSPARVG